jgi:IPT/TIG domain
LNGINLNNPIPFSYSQPSILSITPRITYPGQAIKITLDYYGSTSNVLQVGITPASNNVYYTCEIPTFISSSIISCVIPTNLPAGNFTAKVTISNQEASTGGVTGLVLLPPIIDAIFPSNGSTVGGTLITLTVQNLYELKEVIFSYTSNLLTTDIPATGCLQTGPNTVDCLTPAVPISDAYDVRLTLENAGGTLLKGFTYNPAIVTSISPNNGAGTGNYPISIFGNNFGTNCCGIEVDIIVLFGIAPCTNPTRESDTLITCTAPPVS